MDRQMDKIVAAFILFYFIADVHTAAVKQMLQ